MPIQSHLTPVLLPKPLHQRFKAVVKAKGATIQGVLTLEVERFVTKEEARIKKAVTC